MLSIARLSGREKSYAMFTADCDVRQEDDEGHRKKMANQ